MHANEMGGICSMFGGRGELGTGFWWGELREREHSNDIVVDGKTILNWILRKKARARNGLIWRRIGTRCGLL